MGIDIITYRARVGLFKGKGYIPKEKYVKCCKSSSIHWRTLACMSVLLLISMEMLAIQTASETLRTMTSANVNVLVRPFFYDIELENITMYRAHDSITSTDAMSESTSNNINVIQLLLTCGDIESNPGPVSQDSEQRLMESLSKLIITSENNLKIEMRNIQTQISEMRTEVQMLRKETETTKQDVIDLKQTNEKILAEVEVNKHDINSIVEKEENMQLDIDHLNEKVDKLDCAMENANERLEWFEREHIKQNMRVFNIPVDEGDNNKSLKQIIVDKVLKIANPKINWNQDDLKFAKAISETRDGKLPMTIVAFRYDDDKHYVYQGRDVLREQGIRVGDDLTKSQRTELQRVRNEGKWGYFYKGKLQVKEKDDTKEFNNANERIVVKAKRRLTHADKSQSNDPEIMVTEEYDAESNETAQTNQTNQQPAIQQNQNTDDDEVENWQ